MLKRFTVSFRYQVETDNLRFNLFIINSIKNWTDEKNGPLQPRGVKTPHNYQNGDKTEICKEIEASELNPPSL